MHQFLPRSGYVHEYTRTCRSNERKLFFVNYTSISYCTYYACNFPSLRHSTSSVSLQNALDLTAPASDALLKNRKNAWVQLAGHPGRLSSALNYSIDVKRDLLSALRGCNHPCLRRFICEARLHGGLTNYQLIEMMHRADRVSVVARCSTRSPRASFERASFKRQVEVYEWRSDVTLSRLPKKCLRIACR